MSLKDVLYSPVLAALLFLTGVFIFATNGGNATVYKWSQTAASNSSSDSTINWAEGMAPSAVNDSARAMMAAIAKWNADMAGATTTTGSSNAYVLNTSQSFASLSTMSGQRVCFKPNFTNTSSATLNVDTLGVKALRASTGVELSPGAIVSGTPYCAVYDNSASEWIVTFVNVNTLVPLGAIIDYGGSSAPSSNFAIPTGQAISRTTYAGLFALFSTTYGTGDGSTTFNLPDLQGRVVAMKDGAGTRLTGTTMSPDGNTLGATGGAQTVMLSSGNIPTLNMNSISLNLSSGAINNGTAIVRGTNNFDNAATTTDTPNDTVPRSVSTDTLTVSNTSVTGSISYTNSSQSAVNRMPPTILLNKLLRVL